MKKIRELVRKTGVRLFCQGESEDISLIRYIGILARFGAGKTTTTECMLNYAEKVKYVGEAHHDNIVFNHNQRRELVIPVSSAPVSFYWKKYLLNVIDTPHIDLAIEVERCFNVLDGAVVILDGSAAIEAQTVTVWRQADHYNLPRLIYLNKLDSSHASIDRCLDTLYGKLNVHPILLHIPIYGDNNELQGVIDLITMTYNKWQKEGHHAFESKPLNAQEHFHLWEKAIKQRNTLIKKLAEHDKDIAQEIKKSDSLNIPVHVLLQSVRNITLNQQAVPIVCGSSFKNIGVQFLMDAVINFLPCPVERNNLILHCFKDALCARAFKVIHDKQKEPITFFRIYSGSFVKGQHIYNIQQAKTEQVSGLMLPYADEIIDVPSVSHGKLAAVKGLKKTMSGDFVTLNASLATSAKKILSKYQAESPQEDFGQATKVPAPVFFCSIQVPSKDSHTQLDSALQHLQREDPSLVVTKDELTGQTLLGGTGEFHLNTIKTRIISEYKVNVSLGYLQIAYQENPQKVDIKNSHMLEYKTDSSQQNVSLVMTLLAQSKEDKNTVLLDKSPDSSPNIANLNPRYLLAIIQGVNRALSHGPKLRCPVVDTCVMLHWCETGKGTTEQIVSTAATQCVQKMLKAVGTRLLEPLMTLEILCGQEMSSAVALDLSHRRGHVLKVTQLGQQAVINAQAPLSELLNYTADLQKLTLSNGSFTMKLDSYKTMSPAEEAKAVKKVTGFNS